MTHGTYFTYGYGINNLLFKGFSSTTVAGLVGFCLFVASLTMLYEGIKVFRQRLLNFYCGNVPKSQRSVSARTPESESPKSDKGERSFLMRLGHSDTPWSRTKFHLVQTILYTIQTVLAYLLMLIIMSYNLWLALSIFLASGLAYFVFGISTLTAPVIVPMEFLQTSDNHH